MKEESFRLWIVILLAVFVAGFIVIGLRLGLNGRYTQFENGPNQVIDTRTGNMKSIN